MEVSSEFISSQNYERKGGFPLNLIKWQLLSVSVLEATAI